MQYFLKFIDENMLEIIIASGSFFVLVFLVRSFKRNMLIEKGQARFVLERYDSGTEKLHKWVTFFIVFMLLPLFAYVKFLGQ
ncbi:hypothetical protein [Kaarinaea lacus]